jgi:hypothetical protein
MTDVVEHDWPSLADPQCCHLLSRLRYVDAFVSHVGWEDLAGVDPGAGTEGSAVCLESVIFEYAGK